MASGEIASPLARALERGRERFNARFAQAQALGRSLDPEAFGRHLLDVVGPIADAVARVRPDRIDAVVDSAYEISIELMSGGLVGPEARHPAIVAGWEKLLPQIPWMISEQPHESIGTVTNALYNLSAQPGVRPDQWIDEMTAIAPKARDLPTLRAIGRVLAWRCGMPQQRQAALEESVNLPPELGRQALGLRGQVDVGGVAGRLRVDPWLTPERAAKANNERRLQIVRAVSGFRGFGGVFLNPPLVALSADGFVARDSEAQWLITADVFGVSLQRLSESLQEGKAQSPFRLDKRGRVSCGGQPAEFPDLAEATSFAGDATTLAVTIARSHAVYLVAMQ